MELTAGDRFLTGSYLGIMGGIVLAVVLVVKLPGDQYPVLLSNWGLFGVFMAYWDGSVMLIMSPVFDNPAGQIFLYCLGFVVFSLFAFLCWWAVALAVAGAITAAAKR